MLSFGAILNFSENSIIFLSPENLGINLSKYNLSTGWHSKGIFSIGLIYKIEFCSIIFSDFFIFNISLGIL